MNLPDDILPDIFLRIPPDEPTDLVYASTVCHNWHRVLGYRCLHIRWAQLHRTPPLLGFFCNEIETPMFVKTTSRFKPSSDEPYNAYHCRVLDCRHGRVLILDPPGSTRRGREGETRELTVWDPITGVQKFLPQMPRDATLLPRYGAVVFAGGDAYDHRVDQDAFRVAIMAGNGWGSMEAMCYSSETDTWSPVATPEHHEEHDHQEESMQETAALVEDAIYKVYSNAGFIVRYNMGGDLSRIDPPPAPNGGLLFEGGAFVYELPEGEGVKLGFAWLQGASLHLWSRERDGAWGARNVINLEPRIRDLAPGMNWNAIRLCFIGLLHGNIAVVGTSVSAFVINLNSPASSRVYENVSNHSTHPYVSFINSRLIDRS